MRRFFRILLAIVASIAILIIYSFFSVYIMGWEHGGGIIPKVIVAGLIFSLWGTLKSKNFFSDPKYVRSDGIGSEPEPNQVEQKKVKLIQDGKPFTLTLPINVIEKMELIRKENADLWKNNDMELLREARRTIKTDSNENKTINESEIHIATPSTENEKLKTQNIELHQDGITVTMSLPNDVIQKMNAIRQQNPEKWKDNEVELVKEAKQSVIEPMDIDMQKKTIAKKQDTDTNTYINKAGTQKQNEIKPNETVIQGKTINRFGNRLESEYRKEIKAEPHWVRQDDIEICIKVDSDVYMKMVEMQNREPKKWVNKEFDLFLAAKKELEY